MGRTYIVAVGYAGAYKAADIIVEHEKELRSRYRSSFVDNMLEMHRAAQRYAVGDTAAAAKGGAGPEAGSIGGSTPGPESVGGAGPEPGNIDGCTRNKEALEENAVDETREASYMPHGYLGALYDLAEERKCGIRVRLRQVPVLQSTIEVCEMYGLNPYTLPTFARLYLTDDPEQLIEELDKPQQEMAACVGYLAEGRDKLIIDKTNVEYMNKIRD